ncbi:hypothetical protein EPN42_11090 [bacterium]|nr:MAG: hypothetical protein EPN42_11090 [bacterium]
MTLPMLRVADTYCGAGGSSAGLAAACAEFSVSYHLTAINHWNVAIASHEANFPAERHWCMDLDNTSPYKLVPEGKLDILWGSPTCTEHSYAKGGHSIDDQKRASAWSIVRMAEALHPKIIIVENVRQFLQWGPVAAIRNRHGEPVLDKNDEPIFRPIKNRRGETFHAWFSAIESLGYTGRWDLLNAADFGEPQTRIRLFVVFAAHGYSYTFPRPTHGKPGTLEVETGQRLPWVPAREIIDFSLPSEDIFERDTPLSPNTIARIEAGIRRYCSGRAVEPFIVALRQHADARSLDAPIPTICAGGTHLGLAEPELRPFTLGQHGGAVARSIDDPMPTVTTDGFIRVCEPFIVSYAERDGKGSGKDAACPKSAQEPLATVITRDRFGVAEPFLIDVRHGDAPHRPKSTDEPLGTITSKNGVGMVEPFIVPQNGDGTASVAEPLGTITTTSRGVRLVEPFLVAHFGERDGQAPRTHSVDSPFPTVTHRGAGDLVEPYLAPTEPRGHSPYVVEIDGALYKLGIRFRMLQPRELASAQGFPEGYVFTGTKTAQTAQIGNAVSVHVALALYRQAIVALGLGHNDEAVA